MFAVTASLLGEKISQLSSEELKEAGFIIEFDHLNLSNKLLNRLIRNMSTTGPLCLTLWQVEGGIKGVKVCVCVC